MISQSSALRARAHPKNSAITLSEKVGYASLLSRLSEMDYCSAVVVAELLCGCDYKVVVIL